MLFRGVNARHHQCQKYPVHPGQRLGVGDARALDESDDGKILGEFRSSGLRPYTLEKARQYGFDQAYLEACL